MALDFFQNEPSLTVQFFWFRCQHSFKPRFTNDISLQTKLKKFLQNIQRWIELAKTAHGIKKYLKYLSSLGQIKILSTFLVLNFPGIKIRAFRDCKKNREIKGSWNSISILKIQITAKKDQYCKNKNIYRICIDKSWFYG